MLERPGVDLARRRKEEAAQCRLTLGERDRLLRHRDVVLQHRVRTFEHVGDADDRGEMDDVVVVGSNTVKSSRSAKIALEQLHTPRTLQRGDCVVVRAA